MLKTGAVNVGGVMYADSSSGLQRTIAQAMSVYCATKQHHTGLHRDTHRVYNDVSRIFCETATSHIDDFPYTTEKLRPLSSQDYFVFTISCIH